MNPGAGNVSSQSDAQGRPPEVGGVRLGPAVAGVLYLLLVLSAALALWVRQDAGALPAHLAQAAPWAFLVFLLAFGAYRLVLVRAKRYPAFKAMFQIGAAVLFFTLLLPRAKAPYESADELVSLMSDSNPNVRALAAEVARHRADAETKYASTLSLLLTDTDEHVQRQAHESLVKIAGTDLGPPTDGTAVKAWRARYK